MNDDKSLFHNAFNFLVNNAAAAGAYTMYAVPPGKRLVVYYLFLQAEADVSITLRSQATDISGAIEFFAPVGATERTRTFECSGAPVFKTITTGDDFILFTSGAVQVNGFGTAIEVHA